ncbi:ComEC/Rec2 family competence protein [Nocardioides sp.]|uniref:ComEC/Rec2 family competence protein n=1 Tax=Nocardioides sp. TaxID=35761 RepID=UPI0035185DB0
MAPASREAAEAARSEQSADRPGVEPAAPARPHDARLPLLALAAWLGAVAGGLSGRGATVLTASLAIGLLVAAAATTGRRRRAGARLVLAAAVLATAALGLAEVRGHSVRAGPLAEVAAERAVVDVIATVVSDPRVSRGPFGDQVVVRVRVHEVLARGVHRRLGAAVVVLGSREWSHTQLGEQVRAQGRLAPSDDDTTAALLTNARAPQRIARPDLWWRGAGAVRAAIRESVAHRPPDQAGLVPALVDGDDAGLDDELQADFATTGLTHLTAVSGTNLTLVVGALLLLARRVGVRRHWLTVVGLLGIVAFVLLARTEPSVLRAAAMGVVGLFAFGPDGRRRGLRALGAAVVVLVLLDPPLALSAGFALSVLATAGIVLLGPPLTERLARWLPHGAAEAIAVPTAAQLACTPIVAGLSGQVSLVAIAANLLAGPFVGPATVLGLLGGLTTLVCAPAGRLLGTLAGWCVGWIIAVARRGADLPQAALPWGTGVLAVAVLTVICLGIAAVLPRLLGRRSLGIALGVVLGAVILGLPGRGLPGSGGGWPPAGWVAAMCDVGQGDALVLATAPGEAVVVDAGPDPDAVDSCLKRLGVTRVPLLVLTHFHADHVNGIAGVLRGRRVGAVESTAVLDPPGGVERVREELGRTGVRLTIAPFGRTRRLGDLTLQVLHPDLAVPVPGAGDGSSANDASVVLLAENRGVRVLLTGDVEPPGQADLARLLPGLDVDVLKLPHHGSSHQDVGWLTSLRAELVLVSVGADNDYGHPSGRILDILRRNGSQVLRTDTDGPIAIVPSDDGPPHAATGG